MADCPNIINDGKNVRMYMQTPWATQTAFHNGYQTLRSWHSLNNEDFRQASDEVPSHSCELAEWTMKYGFIPVRYSGSGTGSDSSSWHWTSVGTDATTMPSGSCCSMPRAKFFCLVLREMGKWEVPFRNWSTQSLSIGKGEKREAKRQVGWMKGNKEAKWWKVDVKRRDDVRVGG